MSSSPMLGFNDNITHQERVFHIQTEDSGVKHPHIISHLYADGGVILKTKKTSYAKHVGADHLTTIVKKMMLRQHRAMCMALRTGRFDYLWDPTAPKPSSSGPGSIRTQHDAPPPTPAIARTLPAALQSNHFVREKSLDEILLCYLLPSGAGLDPLPQPQPSP